METDDAGESTYLIPKPHNPHPGSGNLVFKPGAIIAQRFEIVRFISRGGMGEVYEARDHTLGDPVALKTILPGLADARKVHRFKEEIRSAKRVTHENVCRIHDIFTNSDPYGETLFLSMELLEGETLRKRLARGLLSEEEAFPLIQQISAGLTAIHRAGIVHRDLKPSNVMLATVPCSRTVIMDLGLAREQEVPLGEASAAIEGTWEYIAPEQLTSATPTPAADIYALGAIVYEMVTGRLPFEAPSRRETGLLRLFQSPTPPREFRPTLDPRWERAILRCLERDPGARFPNSSEFVAALRKPGPEHWLSRRTVAVGCVIIMIAAWLSWRWYSAPFSPSSEALKWQQIGVRALEDGTYYSAVRALERAVKVSPRYGLAHLRAAEAWVALDAPDRAREELIRVDADGGRGLTHSEERRLQAVRETLTFDFRSAAATYKTLLQSSPPSEAAASLVDYGAAAERNAQFNEAISSYSQAAKIAPNYAGARLRLGMLYARRQEVARANTELKEALALYQAASNLEGVTESLYQTGAFANIRGVTREAVPALQRALEMATTLDNPHQRIRAMLQLSNADFRTGNAEGAMQRSADALSLARSTGLEQLSTRGLIDLGNTAFVRGDRQRAAGYFNEALSFAQRFHNARHAAAALFMLGNIDSVSGRLDAASEKLENALAFYQGNGFLGEVSQTLMLLARVQNSRGEYDLACESYLKQLDLAKKLNDRQQQAAALEGLGRVAEGREDYVEALTRFQQSYEIGVDLGRQSRIAYGALQIANVLWRIGRLSEARRKLDEADRIAKGEYPSLSLSLARVRGEIALSELDFVSAIRWSDKATEGEQAPEHTVENERTRGLALLRLGRLREGAAALERARAVDVKYYPANKAMLELALAESALLSGEGLRALEIATAEAKLLEGHGLESKWRLLAIAALGAKLISEVQRGKEFAEAAALAMRNFRGAIGEENFQAYSTRRDVRTLRGRLLGFGVDLP